MVLKMSYGPQNWETTIQVGQLTIIEMIENLRVSFVDEHLEV